MSLFNSILGAIANPNAVGNADQLGAIFDTVQQLAGSQGGDASANSAVMSAVGSVVRSALQEKQATGGADMVQGLIGQFAGTSPNPAAVSALFGQGQQEQVAQMVAQRTGMDVSQIMAILPMAVPLVLNLLHTGSSASGQPGAAGNPVLNAFLDGDGDGDVDLGDLMKQASRFLG